MSAILDLLNLLDPELWVITSGSPDQDANGLLATFVMNASIDPRHPRFVIGLAKAHRTAELMMETGLCGLHLLHPDQGDLAFQLGTQSGHQVHKLKQVRLRSGTSGVAMLEDCLGALEARVIEVADLGDRWLFVVMVVDSVIHHQIAPLKLHEWLAACTAEHHEVLDAQLRADAYHDREGITEWLRQIEQASEQSES